MSLRQGGVGLGMLAATLVLGACAPGTPQVTGTASPIPGQSPPPSNAATAEGKAPETPKPQSGTKAPETTKPQSGTKVLGPDGYGSLKLGMDEKLAEASGMLGTPNPNQVSACAQYPLLAGGSITNGQATFSSDKALVSISPPKGTKTPEGIGVGSTFDQVTAAYKDLGAGPNGSQSVSVPGNPNASYRIGFENGKVYGISLESKNGDTCAG
jgi:hypothetical protein